MAFPDDFKRRVKCTIQASLVDAGLSFFPVLLTEVCLPQGNDEIFDADGLHPAQNGGGDLRFSSDEAGLNRIPCEIVTFVTDNTPGDGVAEIWVAVPSISSSVDTDIWLWWEGGGSETQPAEDAAFGKENTWDENGADNFVLVQHLNEDPAGAGDRAIDSTLFDNDGNPTGSMDIADLVTGAFGAGLQGSAWDFDGGNDSVALPTSASLDLEDVSFVISAWVRPVSSPPTDAVFFSIHNAESPNESIHVRTSSNEQIRFGFFSDDLSSPTGELTNGAWNYVVATRDQPGDESKIFNAGVEVADNSAGPFVGPPARNDIGRWGSTDNQFYEGTIDEVRVTSGVIRDDAWFGAEFENQNDPNSFIVEGIPEAVNQASAAVTGTATATIDEDDIVAGGKTVIITLTDDEWVASGGTFNGQRQNIIDGLNSAQSELLGWNNEVRDNLSVGSVSRTSDTEVTITLSAQSAYEITATETIEVTVPASAVIGAGEIVATPTFTVTSLSPSAAVTGTAQPTSTEPQIVAGGRTILITLDNDTWVAVGATFNAQRQAIIDGLDSAQSEALGWNAEVRDKEVVGAVVRTSDTLVTITLTAQPGYDITATETIEATIPASALVTSGIPVVATPTFTVTSVAATAAITGTATATIDEDDVRAGGNTIIITLDNGSWVAAGGTFDAQRQAIIDGLDSAQVEGTGWNAEVRDKEVVTAVVRTSQKVVTITLTAQAAYDITAQETITVTVPASAINEVGAIVGTPDFTVDLVVPPVSIAVTGSLVPDGDEDEIVAGGQTFIVTLTNDTWIANPGFDATRQEIIDGFTSMQSEATGWNAEVRDKMPETDVVRTSDTVMTVTVSAQAGYAIDALEEIEITVPGAAMVLTVGATVATPTFDIIPNPATAAITGTISPISIESQIVAGGRTTIITLAEDTWVAAGAAFNAVRQAIIDGCDSAQVEAAGWNAEVRDKEVVTAVVRTSDTEVTITWTASPLYEITDKEEITVTVPAAAMVLTGSPVVATPIFTIFEVPIALISGTIVPSATVQEIIDGGKTIIITLIDDEWVAAGVEFDDIRQDIIQGLDSDVPELEAPTGWNQLVRDDLPNGQVIRTSDTVVTITLIAFPTYATPRTETITVTVPGEALEETPNDITGIPTFQVVLAAGSKARDRRGGKHAEDIFDVNTPNVETFPVNTFE